MRSSLLIPVLLSIGCASTPSPAPASAASMEAAPPPAPPMEETSTTAADEPPSSETAEELDAGTRMSFDDADADANKRLSRSEVEASGIPVVLTTWDDDADGNLAGDEMYVLLFDTIDANRDRFIDEAERDQLPDRPGVTDRAADAFAEADTDDDRKLDPQESRAFAEALGLVEIWDRNDDGMLSHAELTTFVFDQWDDNDDGELAYGEWVAR